MGSRFDDFYAGIQQQVRFVRMIPADIFEAQQGQVRLSYQDPNSKQPQEELFDLVALAVGLMPAAGTREIIRTLQLDDHLAQFPQEQEEASAPLPPGLFMTGTVLGPMGIAASVAHAAKTADRIWDYLNRNHQ
jgi:heterodisulfide reductase subunit A